MRGSDVCLSNKLDKRDEAEQSVFRITAIKQCCLQVRSKTMKISTRGRYAVRVMLDLALNNTGECIKVKDIAARQDISEKYLEQIIAVLNKAGYVNSVRGAQGGYRLSRDPAEYTVGMILRLTEGSMAPVSCLDESAVECEQCDTCETLEVWRKLYDAINDVIDNVTIADLVARRKQREGSLDYCI